MANIHQKIRVEKLIRVAVHVGSLFPLAMVLWLMVTGNLGFNPVETVLHRTGHAAVALLVLSLAVTPLRRIFRLQFLGRLRKPLGLYAALYAGLHFAAFAVWDYRLNLNLIWMEIVEKPFLIVGLVSLIILVLLAGTSFRFWQRKLGKKWRWLQKTVYLAAGLAVIHYLLAVKGDLLTLQGAYTAPLIAGGLLILLLLLRIPFFYKPIQRFLNHQSAKPGEKE